jgi:hypothetical protein
MVKIPQLAQNYPEFYRTKSFITLFTTAKLLSLFLREINPIYLMLPRPVLILSSHLLLVFSSGIFPSHFFTINLTEVMFSITYLCVRTGAWSCACACVHVALLVQYATHICYIVASLCPHWLHYIFRQDLINGTIFGKKS